MSGFKGCSFRGANSFSFSVWKNGFSKAPVVLFLSIAPFAVLPACAVDSEDGQASVDASGALVVESRADMAMEEGSAKVVEASAVDPKRMVQVGPMSLQRPDGFTVSDLPTSDGVDRFGKRCTVTHSVALIGEESTSFSAEVCEGVSYGDALAYALSEPESIKAAADENEESFSTPRNLSDELAFEPIDQVILNGKKAFFTRWSADTPNGRSYGIRCCVKISDYAVGVVTSAYSETQLSVLGDVWTPVFTSIVAIEE